MRQPVILMYNWKGLIITEISFINKTVLITGATGDLGRVMTRTFAKSGADIIIHYLKNAAMAEELRKEVEACGGRAEAIQADITRQDDVNAMRDRAARTIGQPHIVINNAVSQYNWKPIIEQPPEDFIDQMETCVMHNVYMAQAFIPAMKERGYGRFIGINTECAFLCDKGSGAYASAKRGMDGIYRTLAKEVAASGVTVNQIAPGWMISDRDHASGKDSWPEYEGRTPMGRRGCDQDIANAAVFLASDLASYITGIYLPVTGGRVMPGI